MTDTPYTSLASALQLLYRLARGLTTSRDVLSDVRRLDGVTTLLIALDRCEGRCSYLTESVGAIAPSRERVGSRPRLQGADGGGGDGGGKPPLTPKRGSGTAAREGAGREDLPELIQTTSPERAGGEQDEDEEEEEEEDGTSASAARTKRKASPWTTELLARYRHPMCCICDVLSELAMDDALSKQICVGNGVYLLGRILTFGEFYEPGRLDSEGVRELPFSLLCSVLTRLSHPFTHPPTQESSAVAGWSE